jgi:hypothetical protein
MADKNRQNRLGRQCLRPVDWANDSSDDGFTKLSVEMPVLCD